MKSITYTFLLVLAALIVNVSTARADNPSVHGMLLFGGHSTYASHLPMFHAPHDYQLILKLSLLDSTGGSVIDKFEVAKKTSKDIFTLVPEVMDLVKVMDGSKKSFAAEIYQGHFERGGVSLGSVTVNIEKILLSTKLDAKSKPDNDYFMFGESGEYFAAHLIKGKPNFDAIVGVSQPYTVHEQPCRTRVCPNPTIKTVDDSKLPLIVKGTVFSIDAPIVGDFMRANDEQRTDIMKVIYFESGELAH